MGLGLGLGIWWSTQTSIIPSLLKLLEARADYFENKICTTAILEEIAAVRYTAPPLPVYTDNLVASYSFDTDFSDYTGNNDLTASGDAIAGVTGGKVSDCAELDGNNDYTIAADSDDFSFTNGTNDLPFSISLWANFNTIPSGSSISLFNKSNLFSGNGEYIFTYINNQIAFGLYSNGVFQDNIETKISFAPIINVWNHITVTYDGSAIFGGIKIYINGVSQAITNSSTGTYVGMVNGSKPFHVGSRGWSPSTGEFDGKLDELHIWKNRELTSAEVLDIYNTENAGNSIL